MINDKDKSGVQKKSNDGEPLAGRTIPAPRPVNSNPSTTPNNSGGKKDD